MLGNSLLHDLQACFEPETITAVAPMPSTVSLPDSTTNYAIRTTGDEFILIVSSDVSPLLVKRAADRQKEARAQLRGLAAEPIELPVYEGFAGEKSYAVWPKRQPLSSNRIRSIIERTQLAPRVFRWLRDVAAQTAKTADLPKLLANLQRLQEIPAAPTSIKLSAEKAWKSLSSGEVPPIQVVHHGDLWTGNVLKTSSKTGFIVIDWAGARLDGAPFFDLVKFALSVGSSKSTLSHEIAAHSRLLGCDPRHAPAYVLSGFGALHSELEYFPQSNFLNMCEQNLRALQAVTPA
jgi:phosphotransferase family enzyme